MACMCLYSAHLLKSTEVNDRRCACYVYSAVCLSLLCDEVNWANTASISSLSAGRWLDWLWAGLCTASADWASGRVHTCTLTWNYMFALTNMLHYYIPMHHANGIPGWINNIRIFIVFLIGRFFCNVLLKRSFSSKYMILLSWECACVCVCTRSTSLTASPTFLFPLPNITFLNSIADVIFHDDHSWVLLPAGFVY